MNYDGEIIHENYIEMNGGYSPGPYGIASYHLVRSGSNYILYLSGEPLSVASGKARACPMMYLDEDFNLLHFRYLDYSAEGSLTHPTVKRISQNTVLLTGRGDGAGRKDNVQFMEVNDNLDDFHIVKCEKRGDELFFDAPFMTRGFDFINENEIFWAYGLGYEFTPSTDTYLTMEKMDRNLNTIQEVFYDIPNSETWGSSIVATKDGGVLLMGTSKNLHVPGIEYSFVAKFPAEAFMSVEEAHKNNLHVAMAFPNPGNNVLNIKTSLQNASIEVYDIFGKLVYKQDITENITAIPTEGWNSGMYLWKVYSNEKEVESGKWVKR